MENGNRSRAEQAGFDEVGLINVLGVLRKAVVIVRDKLLVSVSGLCFQ